MTSRSDKSGAKAPEYPIMPRHAPAVAAWLRRQTFGSSLARLPKKYVPDLIEIMNTIVYLARSTPMWNPKVALGGILWGRFLGLQELWCIRKYRDPEQPNSASMKRWCLVANAAGMRLMLVPEAAVDDVRRATRTYAKQLATGAAVMPGMHPATPEALEEETKARSELYNFALELTLKGPSRGNRKA